MSAAPKHTYTTTVNPAGEVIQSQGTNPTLGSTPESTITAVNDSLGRLIQVTQNSNLLGVAATTSKFGTTYFADGNRNAVTLNLNQTPNNAANSLVFSRTTYGEDYLQRITSIQQDLALTSTSLWANGSVGPDKNVGYGYFQNGQLQKVTSPNGLTFDPNATNSFRGVSTYQYFDNGAFQSLSPVTDFGCDQLRVSPLSIFPIKYSGNQGIDLAFSGTGGNAGRFALAEAKLSGSLGSLKVDSLGIRQGSFDFFDTRLQRAGRFDLQQQLQSGNVDLFGGFANSGRLFQFDPILFPRNVNFSTTPGAATLIP